MRKLTKFYDTPCFLIFNPFSWLIYLQGGGSVGEFFGGVIVGDTIGEKPDVDLMRHGCHPFVDRRTQLMAIRSNEPHHPGHQ